MKKRIAIVGGGPSGLVAAKECREAGLEPTVFEKSDDIGGVWSPKHGKVWQSMRTNLSHFHMGFSDYFWPDTMVDFPSNSDVYTYLKDYAAAFSLGSHIAYNQEVVSIAFDWSKKDWRLQTANGADQHFDYTIIASGVFNKNALPAIKGLERFTGQVCHSGKYRCTASFTNQETLIVGGSFSAFEIAADLAKNGVSVTHVFRRPSWIVPRYTQIGDQAVPLDIVSYTYPFLKERRLNDPEGRRIRNEELEKRFGNPGNVHPALRIPQGSTDFTPLVISDDYCDLVAQNKIIPICGSVDHFTENACLLSSDNRLPVNAVIFCTGYDVNLPIQDSDLIKSLSYDPNDKFMPLLLNKEVFHPHYPSLAFVGLYRGPYFGTMEMQARWAAAVFSEQVPYPSEIRSQEGLREADWIRNQEPRPHFPRSNYVGYMLEMARELRVLPQKLLQDVIFHAINNPEKRIQMLPADFRHNGIGANPFVTHQQRHRLNHRMGIVNEIR